jgi:hypothetical protein
MVLLELFQEQKLVAIQMITNYNFTIVATDAESQTAPRAFSITVTASINNAGQFN